jgi:hypothetical protein
MSRDEAFQYFRLQNIDNKIVAQIYKLIGGYMILFKSIVRNIQNGDRFDGMCTVSPYSLSTDPYLSLGLHYILLHEAKGQLRAAEMLPRGKFYKQERVIISKLLKKNTISDYTFWALVEDNEIGEKILQKNVFSYHFYADNVTFQSTLMKQYYELYSTLWEG